jgi:hypothetical protein
MKLSSVPDGRLGLLILAIISSTSRVASPPAMFPEVYDPKGNLTGELRTFWGLPCRDGMGFALTGLGAVREVIAV